MKRLMKKFEDIMVAITFAEAGELEMSKELLACKEEPGINAEINVHSNSIEAVADCCRQALK